MRAISRAAALAVIVAALYPGLASAHISDASSRTTWRSWHLDPLVAIGVLLAAWLYWRGLAQIWSKAGRGNGISHPRAVSFFAGIGFLILALCSPIDAAANQLLSAHMLQHMLLVLFAAPLLAAGAPLPAFASGLPRALRPTAIRTLHSPLLRTLRHYSSPLVATLAQAIVFWLWHLPTAYEAALRHESVHAFEHVSMLASGIWFWAAVIPALGRRRDAGGTEILAITLAGMQCGMLGALLTFSGTAWYSIYTSREALWHLTPTTDQQLAGLVMWIPGGTIYLIAALLLVPLWLRSDEIHLGSNEQREKNDISYAPALGVLNDRR
jgi:putative membrane protein